jgi:hypothetical protein
MARSVGEIAAGCQAEKQISSGVSDQPGFFKQTTAIRLAGFHLPPRTAHSIFFGGFFLARVSVR